MIQALFASYKVHFKTKNCHRGRGNFSVFGCYTIGLHRQMLQGVQSI